MAPEDERRSGPGPGTTDFEGRDLLVGRPEGTQGGPTASAEAAPAAPATSPLPGMHDDALREILEAVQVIAARPDTLQDAPGSEHDTAEMLARETAALTRSVEDARAALANAAELAASRDGAAEAARMLAEGAAALKAQGEALDKRLRATGKQAAAAAENMDEMKQAATALDSSLRTLGADIVSVSRRLRWRPWPMGLAIGAASFVFFVLGAVLQRETDVVSFGDPRREWNEFVAEHYAPTIAACASEARTDNVIIGCRLRVHPSLDVTIPLNPDIILTDVPPEEQGDPAADR